MIQTETYAISAEVSSIDSKIKRSIDYLKVIMTKTMIIKVTTIINYYIGIVVILMYDYFEDDYYGSRDDND